MIADLRQSGVTLNIIQDKQMLDDFMSGMGVDICSSMSDRYVIVTWDKNKRFVDG